MRGALDLLDRRYRLLEGLGSLPPQEQADAERVRAFALALPAPRPLRMVAVAVAILVVTQLLTFPLSRIVRQLAPSGEGSAQLTGVFTEISNLDPSGIDDALALLLTTNVGATSLLLLVVCVAAFLVLRPRAAGEAVAQRLLREHVSGRERATFARLDLEPPAEPRMRFAVSALPAIAGLLLAVVCLQLVVEGQLAWISWRSASAQVDGGSIKFVPSTGMSPVALGAAMLGAARLGWLAVAMRRRGGGIRPSLGAFAQAGGRTPQAKGSSSRRVRLLAQVAVATVAALCVGAVVVMVASLDRHPPGMEVAIETDRISERRLDISLDCDETCQVVNVWLSGLDREGGRSWLATVEEPAAFTFEEASDERSRTVYRLSPKQQRALMGRVRGVALGVDAVDRDGNQTTMCLPIRVRDRACPDNAKLDRVWLP
ncbi:hypothetical protein VSS74_13045 [Conexibacter stalactiti]|uniref:Uncharacterized protein n=1 Tax=Conexibacter stalactiti TaxID=1940611 RepID=A0ABU4HPU5_9ACTN|nr:hypothetical protein [Conexibacter stalactiti]MDW5595269.1 hypothetical protein [Conexibacter stalactiti]MEC5035911.1 hypothetical protein [Conexibacter stalactiti]